MVVVAVGVVSVAEADWNGGLYRPTPPREDGTEMTALPYYLWSNRGPGRMMVWIPEA